MITDIAQLLKLYQKMVDEKLQAQFHALPASRLTDAMAYSVFNGGKRIRPALCYASAALFGEINDSAHRAAMALELIHAYSLIHDDLPAMDDDDLRRGKATCHIAFDEATAILAGDALQTLAFSILAEGEGDAAIALALTRQLAAAAGAQGMVLGQAMDMAATEKTLSLAELETMHCHKTGALLQASILMGAAASGAASDTDMAALASYGSALGLAFQVKDDILDVESATAVLGKRQGADEAHSKATYTRLLGLDGAKAKLAELHQAAISAAKGFGARGAQLLAIADFVVTRNH